MKHWLVWMGLIGGCHKTETPKYHWAKSPNGWSLSPIDGKDFKGEIAFDHRTDGTIGLTSRAPKDTEVAIGPTAHATFAGGESIVMLDISQSLGAAPVSIFAEDTNVDEYHPTLTPIPITVRFPDSDAFSTTLVRDVARPVADGLLDKMLKGPIGFADEIANDPADTALVVVDTNYDAHFERTVSARGPGKTLAQVDWIAYLDHVDGGNRNCGSYTDGHSAPTEMLMVFHATRVRLFDRRKGTLLGTTNAKGKQACPTKITVTGEKMGDLPVVFSGGSDIFDGGDEALAWLDKQLAKLRHG